MNDPLVSFEALISLNCAAPCCQEAGQGCDSQWLALLASTSNEFTALIDHFIG